MITELGKRGFCDFQAGTSGGLRGPPDPSPIVYLAPLILKRV